MTMLSNAQIVRIAKIYISNVSNGELMIFPDFLDFGSGILFNYQSKEFIETGNGILYGSHNPFIIRKQDGLIFHDLKNTFSSEQDLIRMFELGKLKPS